MATSDPELEAILYAISLPRLVFCPDLILPSGSVEKYFGPTDNFVESIIHEFLVCIYNGLDLLILFHIRTEQNQTAAVIGYLDPRSLRDQAGPHIWHTHRPGRLSYPQPEAAQASAV